MSESIPSTLISALPAATKVSDTDIVVLENGSTTQKITIAQLKEALGINALNTNLSSIGSSAKFYVDREFYSQANSYNGLLTGGVSWNNISGLKFVGSSDYKHYFTFPNGTYLVNINLFSDTVLDSTMGVALKIEVDDTEFSNPWFRMVHAWQSIIYSCVITGNKFKMTIFQDRTIQIHPSAQHSFIEFIRLR